MEFGELKGVELREAWKNEANDFTPWLANNLERLSECLGVQMDLEATEVRVGKFAADILAINPSDNSRILIENQLEPSDHTHLGQVLTYVAGLEAQTIVWVARAFDPSHLSAVRWLNEHTADPFNFFAVQVRVVQIGDSSLVPIFEAVERPSDWDRQVRETIKHEISEIAQLRRDFWNNFSGRHPEDGVPHNTAGASVWITIPQANLVIAPYMAKGDVGVCIRGRMGESRESVEEKLEKYAVPLQEQGLDISAPTNFGTYAYRVFQGNTRDRGNWDRMADWLHENITDYRTILEAALGEPKTM